MRRTKPKEAILLCLGLMLLIGFSHQQAQALLERERQAKLTGEDILPPLETVKACTLGFDQLVADLYWLSFVQYVGDTVARQKDHSRIANKYIDLITGLNPHLLKAYWFAAFIIGSEQHDPQRAAEIIQRGIEANQYDWYMPFIAGINQYLYAHNDVAAARFYRIAAKYPDAPQWLGKQATLLEKKIPSIIKETNVWDSIYRTSSDNIVKQRAKERLVALWRRIHRDATTQWLQQRSLSALTELGAPLDPSGN